MNEAAGTTGKAGVGSGQMDVDMAVGRMTRVIAAAAAAAMVACAAIRRSPEALPFAASVALCASVNVLKLRMLRRAVDKAMAMDGKAAGGYVRVQHMVRLAVTGAAVALCASAPILDVWGAVAGALTYQAATVAMRFRWGVKAVGRP